MEDKDIIGIAIDRGSAINGYWNLYVAVATGIVGIMSTGQAFTNSKSLKVILIVAFIVFASSNLSAILRLGDLRTVLLDMLPNEMDKLRKNLEPSKKWQYYIFHGILDILVVAAIWVVPWLQSAK